jgi:hypothetical protein
MPPFTFYHSICTSAPFLCLPNSFGSPSCCNMPAKNKCICGSNKEEKIVPSRGGGSKLVPCFWYAVKGAAPVGNGPLGFIHQLCLLALGLFGLLGDYQTRFEEELAVFLQKRCLRYKYVQTLLDTFPSPTTTRPWPKAPFTPIKFTQDETPLVSFSDGIMQTILTAVQQIDSSKSLEDLDSSEFHGSLHVLAECHVKTIFRNDVKGSIGCCNLSKDGWHPFVLFVVFSPGHQIRMPNTNLVSILSILSVATSKTHFTS